MTEPSNTKTAAAELQLDGDQSGNYLGAAAVHKINEPNNGQQTWWRDAEIILAARAASGAPFTADDLREFATGKIARHKIPRYVHVVEEFPMTVTGKVRKVEMRTASARELGLGE